MKRCSPVQSRKNLEIAHNLAKSGVNFIPVPVFGDFDEEKLVQLMMQQLVLIEQEASEE